MAKMKVAIYDSDKRYRERFADYLMNYKAQEMDLSVFTGINFLLEALAVDKYQLVVLGCGYEEVLPKLRSLLIPVLVLTEISNGVIKESSGLMEEHCSFTPKYQSMDEITRQMFMLVEPEAESITGAAAKVIGIISPVRDEMQLLFSLLYTKNLAEKEKVLYLNLMEFSGFYEIFGEKQYDLTDAILTMRTPDETWNSLLGCIYEQDGFSYICPVKNPQDTKEINGQEIRKLIRYAVQKLGYETVVIDIGGIIEGFPELLGECTNLYCITKSGGLFAVQKNQFLAYVRSALGEAYLEKIIQVELPHPVKAVVYGEHLLEQLNWSEFGDYVRRQTRR